QGNHEVLRISRTLGTIAFHCTSGCLLTVMKSASRSKLVTPVILKSSAAKGWSLAASAVKKLNGWEQIGWLRTNFFAFGLGVGSITKTFQAIRYSPQTRSSLSKRFRGVQCIL